MILKFKTTTKIRLDIFLRLELPKKFPDKILSNSKIRRLIISQGVSVNNVKILRPAFVLLKGSVVEVDFQSEKFFFEKTPDDIKFDLTLENVLFEDDYFIIVNKPAFFPTEETIVGSEKRDSLHNSVIRYLWNKNPSLKNPPYAGIMHRLDRETSGIILFTKKREVNKAVSQMFLNHDFLKVYTSLSTYDEKLNHLKNVNSDSKNFSLELTMNRISSKSQRGKWGFVPEEKGGLYSKTEFTVKTEFLIGQKKVYQIESKLFTGRTHQIRFHLSYSGFPILGDELYGGIKDSRIMLHSSLFEFIHPVTKEKIHIESKPDFLNQKCNFLS